MRGLYWVARYFTGVVDHVGRLLNKYSYRRNLVFNVGRYMHVYVCWYSTVEIVSLCVAGGVIKHHMHHPCFLYSMFSISETIIDSFTSLPDRDSMYSR